MSSTGACKPPLTPSIRSPVGDRPSRTSSLPLLFEGSLEQLLAAVEKGHSGLVIDLQGATIASEERLDTTARVDVDVVEEVSPHSASPHSSNSLASVESCPSEVLLAGSGGSNAACVTTDQPPANPSHEEDASKANDVHKGAGITPSSSHNDLANMGSRVMARHVTSARSKQLQQERKTAARSSPSVPISLASGYDSRDIVSKALEQKEDDKPPPSFVLKGWDVTIRNGTISLPVDHVLLILNNQRILLEDLTITGPGRAWDDATSFPLLHIEGSQAVMTRVVLSGNSSGHGLTLGIGSDVSLNLCVLECNDLSGIMVGGENSRLRASYCTFNRNLQDGAIVCRGGFADFEHCQFSKNEMLGLEIAFGDARVTMRACKIESNMEHGVSAYSGGSFSMESCEICKSHRVGVSVLDEATKVSLSYCDVRDNRHEGILACAGVKVTCTKCKLIHNRMGVEASGADTLVKFVHCQVSNNATNITVNTAAAVELEQSTCAHSKGKGVAVVHPGTKFEAKKSIFAHCATTGLHVSKISSAHLEHCVLEHNQISGIHVTDKGSTIVLEHCSLKGNHTIGVFSNKAGDATLKHSEIIGNGSTGAEVRDRQARLLLANCIIKDNKRVGVYSHSAAVATLVSCIIAGNGVKAMLVGGRENMEMGGGIIEYDGATEVDGEIMMRHSGRALLAESGALTQSLADCSP